MGCSKSSSSNSKGSKVEKELKTEDKSKEESKESKESKDKKEEKKETDDANKEPVINPNIDPNKPMIALTFDDGPSNTGATARILDVLAENNGHATFCVLGYLIGGHEDVINRAVAEGNQVIGHSWSHKDLTKLTDAEIRAELNDTANAIEAASGTRPTMHRPPYGAVNDTIKSISKELGFSIINWNVDARDWKTKNADATYTAVMRDVKDGCIVLCHDYYDSTADAMARIIPELTAQGYQLVTVQELLSFSEHKAEPGEVYFNR
ncbi:MAG: polysaccharide deacetylase family protein [Clostridiales Family XIII bacterium]|nr:polysaccharide deacetylase family protein [Clostridiales Family XIII bacterium]